MAIAQRGSRKIRVQGQEFRWVGGAQVTVQSVAGGGSCLRVKFDLHHAEPGQVAGAISHALGSGWNPALPGPPHVISNGLEILSQWPLLQAAEAGNEGEVERLLGAGDDPNAAIQSWSAMLKAAVNGHLVILQMLLAAGADPNARPGGHSLMSRIAAGGHAEAARIVLEAGADPDGGADDWPPMGQAVAGWQNPEGSVSVVAALLAYGADPNRRDVHGRTALWRAEEHSVWDALCRGELLQIPLAAAMHSMITLLKEAGGTH